MRPCLATKMERDSCTTRHSSQDNLSKYGIRHNHQWGRQCSKEVNKVTSSSFFTSYKSLMRETVRWHSILTSLKWRGLSLESQIRFTVKEWREKICEKRCSEDLVRKNGAINATDFYAGNRIALFIDLSSMRDNDLYRSGLRLVNTKEGVQLAIKVNYDIIIWHY